MKVKNSVQNLVLGKILESVEEVYGSEECRLHLNLNPKQVKKYGLNPEYICDRIYHSIKSKIKKKIEV